MGRRIIRGYWNCNHCGTTDIAGNVYTCPNCNKTRGEDVVFHHTPQDKREPIQISPNSIEYRQAKAGPDWTCSYCDSNNPADQTICKNCGHPRDKSDKNYFELHPERANTIIPDNGVAIPNTIADFVGDHLNNIGSMDYYDDSDSNSAHQSHDGATESYLDDSRFSNHRDINSSFFDDDDKYWNRFSDAISNLPWRGIGIFTAIVLTIVCIIMLLIPKERTITVTDMDWECKITIEEYRTIRESDWNVPPGGRVVYTQNEIHHYDQVIDHYEKVPHERTIIVGSHEEVDSYNDLGNGHFEEITHTVYDYDTETYYTDEPVYRNEPIYRTKYYYDIERWVYDHTETAKAHDKKPHWPEVKLASSNQREGDRFASYGLSATYKGKESHYTLDYEDWRRISVGDQLRVKVYVTGHIEPIYE